MKIKEDTTIANTDDRDEDGGLITWRVYSSLIGNCKTIRTNKHNNDQKMLGSL